MCAFVRCAVRCTPSAHGMRPPTNARRDLFVAYHRVRIIPPAATSHPQGIERAATNKRRRRVMRQSQPTQPESRGLPSPLPPPRVSSEDKRSSLYPVSLNQGNQTLNPVVQPVNPIKHNGLLSLAHRESNPVTSPTCLVSNTLRPGQIKARGQPLIVWPPNYPPTQRANALARRLATAAKRRRAPCNLIQARGRIPRYRPHATYRTRRPCRTSQRGPR